MDERSEFTFGAAPTFNNADGKPKYSTDDTFPDKGSIHKGKVQGVKDFGLFVSVPGWSTNGLVHISQLFKADIGDMKPSDAANVGDTVFVKVMSVRDGKIALSIKYVNQTSGEDLDPNGVAAQQEEQKRKLQPRERQPMRVTEAVLDITCSKCGGTGHLPQDCFGTKYELLDEEEFVWPSRPDAASKSSSHKHDRKGSHKHEHKSRHKHEHKGSEHSHKSSHKHDHKGSHKHDHKRSHKQEHKSSHKHSHKSSHRKDVYKSETSKLNESERSRDRIRSRSPNFRDRYDDRQAFIRQRRVDS